jgi:hypothetical protein
MDAASGRSDNCVEVLKATDEQGFRGCGIFLAAAVSHWLPAAGLIERILDRAPESFEEFQSCDAHFREKGVNVTGNEKPDFSRARAVMSQMSGGHRLSFRSVSADGACLQQTNVLLSICWFNLTPVRISWPTGPSSEACRVTRNTVRLRVPWAHLKLVAFLATSTSFIARA